MGCMLKADELALDPWGITTLEEYITLSPIDDAWMLNWFYRLAETEPLGQ